MFGILALITFILPWIIIPAMAVLIWLLRRRLLRASLALATLVLVALTHSREFLYAIGLGLPHPDEESGALISAFRALVSAMEWYAWQSLALAAVSAALLSWPLPDGKGKRALAVMVMVGLGVSAALVWSFTGVRFNSEYVRLSTVPHGQNPDCKFHMWRQRALSAQLIHIG